MGALYHTVRRHCGQVTGCHYHWPTVRKNRCIVMQMRRINDVMPSLLKNNSNDSCRLESRIKSKRAKVFEHHGSPARFRVWGNRSRTRLQTFPSLKSHASNLYSFRANLFSTLSGSSEQCDQAFGNPQTCLRQPYLSPKQVIVV